MFFLRNNVMNNLNKNMLKNKRVYSDWNNNGCNLDIETKKKIQYMFVLTPSLYVLTICNFALTIGSILIK
jgi:hypothetical protein